MRLLISVNNSIHRFRALLGLMFVYAQHLERHRVRAESDGDYIADFHFFCGFDRLAVDFDASAVASLLGNGAAFDDSRYFQKFVYSHNKYYMKNARLNQEVSYIKNK